MPQRLKSDTAPTKPPEQEQTNGGTARDGRFFIYPINFRRNIVGFGGEAIDIDTKPEIETQSRRFGDELYGVYDLLEQEDPTNIERVAAKIYDQETTHIAEGIRLRQRKPKLFQFDGQCALDPYSDEAMVVVAQRGVETTANGLEGLNRRMQYDVAAEIAANELMKHGTVGEGFWRASPYGHEWDDAAARNDAGMWPEFLRSYVHVYRKVDPQTLEVTTVTVDQSDLEAYRCLLADYGVNVPTGFESHDFPRLHVPFSGLLDELDRNEYIDGILAGYETYRWQAKDNNSAGELLADTFVSEHGAAIEQIVRLNMQISDSLQAGSLTGYAQDALKEAWQLTHRLGLIEEQLVLEGLLYSEGIDLDKHHEALRLLLNIQRYGVWQYLSLRLDGLTEYSELDQHDIQAFALQAALAGGVMPGCSGGFSLEAMFDSIWSGGNWHGGAVHIGTCEGCQQGPKPVGVRNWCKVCIKGHCG